ncbi:cytidylyltransferase domain-containing protein [Chrysiogenes arsenatis]|uniref:acylneuraminate cytidylyltransferase family protein n=1 Tax=Chrysiogenes arsenatis TaxID=309797 RepID=UPI00041265AA|nr:acylneuraminate cytidylyltransferase family protein [Chrysiogenes arsenatis]
MYKGKSFLAIIPARGGSKRLPRKNVLDLAGKPLIAWTIEAAQKSKFIDRVIVSTDDAEIEAVAHKWTTETIKRPSSLATDTATSVDVVLHVIEAVEEKYDYVVLLQPTSPLRTTIHIDEAIELLIEKSADAIISVCEVEHNPLWCNTIPEDGSMQSFIKDESKNKRSQDLPKYYRLNGAVYICNTRKLLNEKNFFLNDNIYAYMMAKYNSIDIDTDIDFIVAEVIKGTIHV